MSDTLENLDIADELIAERRGSQVGETPDDMAPWMARIIRPIDQLNLWIGRIFCLLIIPMIGVIIYDVIGRGLLTRSSDIGYEYSRMFSGVIFMAGAGYALLRGVHIRADFIYRTMRPRTQAIVDAALYILFYFPSMLFFFWVSLDYTFDAWSNWERSMDTAAMTPLAPARTAMPIGAALLILQGISEFLKCLYTIKNKRWP